MMRHLQEQRGLPKEGFKLNFPLEQLAQILYTCYVDAVNRRSREYVVTERINEVIWEIAEILTVPSYRFCTILSGECGCGKTTMLRAIRATIYYLFNRYGEKVTCGVDLARGVPIVAAKDIVTEMVKDEKNYVANDILMIDDMGNEPTEVVSYGMIYTPIIDLLEKRYDLQKTTFISTNLSEIDIRPKYKNRVADRLNEMANFIDFDLPSFRVL